MELSKEVHGLLDRIKRMSQQSQNNENISDMRSAINTSYTERNLDTSTSSFSGSMYENEDLIPVENMDFSDDERWLYVSDNPAIKPYTGDLMEWLRQDFNKSNNYCSNLPMERDYDKMDSKKIIDTRTFTRPKKRISRPSLEQFTEGYFMHDRSRNLSTDCISENSSKSSVSDFLCENTAQSDSTHSLGNMLNTSGGPVHFKLSEPVYNISFDNILATAKNCIDSFQNMSPPSLINSLCSSSMMDSGYVNPEHVPNICNDVPTCVPNQTISVNENADPNATCSMIELPKNVLTEKNNTYTEPSPNETFDKKVMNKTIDVMNSTYSKSPESAFNATFQKNMNNKTTGFGYHNLSGSNTITRKPKQDKLSSSLKSSCPDINRTFRKGQDYALGETFQKLSDSQPNLSEDLKRTIYNQSMELMHPVIETYGSRARSGSADSLDERSSSISNSSKDSGTKIMNIDDLDGLAKMQEQTLHQVMSTPKPAKPSNLLLWEEDVLSPIQNRLGEDLSDSDMSDSYTTARSGYSKRPVISAPVARNNTRSIPNKQEVSQSSHRTLPTMIVKPLEVNKAIVPPSRPQSVQQVRPKIRASGLPRPTGIPTTGIPRPMSRIPGPKTTRLQLSRPVQRPPPKVDGWMDGCY